MGVPARTLGFPGVIWPCHRREWSPQVWQGACESGNMDPADGRTLRRLSRPIRTAGPISLSPHQIGRRTAYEAAGFSNLVGQAIAVHKGGRTIRGRRLPGLFRYNRPREINKHHAEIRSQTRSARDRKSSLAAALGADSGGHGQRWRRTSPGNGRRKPKN